MRSPRPSARLSLIAVCVCLAALLPNVASAATLGGLSSRSLFSASYVIATSGITEPFSYPNNYVLGSNGSWTVTGGTFSVNGEVAQASSGTVTAVLPQLSSPNMEASVNIRAQGKTNGGLLLHSDADGAPAVLVTYSNGGSGTITLSYRNAQGTLSTLASVSSVGSAGGGNFRTIAARYENGTYQITHNGILVLTHTLTPSLRANVESYRGVGIVAINNEGLTFDNFNASSL